MSPAPLPPPVTSISGTVGESGWLRLLCNPAANTTSCHTRPYNALPSIIIKDATIYYQTIKVSFYKDCPWIFTVALPRASLPYHTLQYMSYQFKYCRDAVVSSIRLDARALYKWPLFINHEFQKTENGCITAITSTSI